MTIKTRKPAAGTRIERKIITAMIVSTDFLKCIEPIYSRYPESPFSLSWAAIISNWIIEYYHKYKKAPQETIQDIFNNNIKSIQDESVIELIEIFLSDLSEEFKEDEEINVPYLMDQAEEHFRLQALRHVSDNLRVAISRHDIGSAEEIIGNFERITRPETVGIDPIGDINEIEQAFSSEDRDLLCSLPDTLGAISEFLGPFEKGSFIAFMGKEGAGKSWFLQQLALEAVLATHNVLFVSMEMSKTKMIRRMHQYLNLETKQGKVGDVLIPVFDCKLNQENNCSKSCRTCNVGLLDKKGLKPRWNKEKIEGEYKITFLPRVSKSYVPCTSCRGSYNWMGETWFVKENKKGLTINAAKNKAKAISKSMLKGRKMKFIQYAVGKKSINDLEVEMRNLQFYENFYPSFLFTDYAAKFLSDSREEKRHQLRKIFERHKAIAQEYYMQVITASQTNVTRNDDKMGTKAITKGSWQESMAPQAECDRAFAINQTAMEKRDGIMRLNMLKERDDDYDQLKELTILYSHDLGRAILDSEILKKWD